MLHNRIIYTLFRPLGRLVLRVMIGFRGGMTKGLPKKGQYVVLSNHNNDLDVVAISAVVPGVPHFLASDHILKWKPWGKIIQYCFAPIPIMRAQVDIKAIKDSLQCKKEGGSIGIFPEGGCSYTGRTGYISPATAKLVKQFGLPVYLFKIHGNYLARPGCTHSWRRGRVTTELARVLSAEEVKSMSLDDLYKAICDGLYVDAFEEQRVNMVPFRGKRLAEDLEMVLYHCPKCGEIGHIHSHDDRVFCDCGYSVRMNKYGFFEGDEVIYDCVSLWDDWQREEIVRRITDGTYDTSGQTPVMIGEDEILVKSERGHDTGILGRGTYYLYSDRMEFHGKTEQGEDYSKVWMMEDIVKLRAMNFNCLQFSIGESEYYELRSDTTRSSYKYMLHFFALKQHLKGLPMDFFGL